MGALTRKQFDILSILANKETKTTQRQLCERSGYSLGTVNRVCNELKHLSCLDEGGITMSGLSALEPYRVRRAIFIAAGFGTRLVPVTLNTPKPLVRVNGQRLIDGLLDAVLAAEIEEIYVVRGYLAEQFDQLLYKYPMIRFLENPAYNESNNISSAMCARYLFQNAYVLEADMLVKRPENIIHKYNYSSNNLGIRRKRCDDWCFTEKNGYIKSYGMGGIDCLQEIGISYWTKEDGGKLSAHLQQAYELPGGKEFYWEQVPFNVFHHAYRVEIREVTDEDIVEIDTYRELKAIDKTYDV